MADTADMTDRRAGADRRSRRVWRFVDRRTGFDRRKRHPLLGRLRASETALLLVLVALNLASWLDGWLTWVALGLGLAQEGNPILRAAVEVHPAMAVALKVGAVALVSLGIWHGRDKRPVLMVAVAGLVLYGGVVAYHLGALRALGVI